MHLSWPKSPKTWIIHELSCARFFGQSPRFSHRSLVNPHGSPTVLWSIPTVLPRFWFCATTKSLVFRPQIPTVLPRFSVLTVLCAAPTVLPRFFWPAHGSPTDLAPRQRFSHGSGAHLAARVFFPNRITLPGVSKHDFLQKRTVRKTKSSPRQSAHAESTHGVFPWISGHCTLRIFQMQSAPQYIGQTLHVSEIPPVLLGIPWPVLKGPLWNHSWKKRNVRNCTGGERVLEMLWSLEWKGLGDPTCILEESSRKNSESVSGVFQNFTGIPGDMVQCRGSDKIPSVPKWLHYNMLFWDHFSLGYRNVKITVCTTKIADRTFVISAINQAINHRFWPSLNLF